MGLSSGMSQLLAHKTFVTALKLDAACPREQGRREITSEEKTGIMDAKPKEHPINCRRSWRRENSS